MDWVWFYTFIWWGMTVYRDVVLKGGRIPIAAGKIESERDIAFTIRIWDSLLALPICGRVFGWW